MRTMEHNSAHILGLRLSPPHGYILGVAHGILLVSHRKRSWLVCARVSMGPETAPPQVVARPLPML